MTLKDWDAIPFTAIDCVRDHNEWNDMVDYIRHSACTNFTIYETCPLTGQAFRFTKSGTISSMLGGDDAGDDLQIYANDTNTQPRICLFGASDIWLDSADEVKFKQNNVEFLNFDVAGTDDIIEGKTTGNDLKIVGVEGIHSYFKAGEEFKLFDGATEALKVTYVGNITTVEGGTVNTDDLILKACSSNTFPYILLPGGGNIQMRVASNLYLYRGNVAYLSLGESGTEDVVEGLTAGNDLTLKSASSLLKWGTEQTNAGSDRGELVPFKTLAGTTVYLKTYNLV